MTDEQIRQLYNKFPPGQTMSFQEFKKELQGLDDPVQMRQDLAEIQMQKAVFRTNKIRADRAIKNNQI